MVGISIAVVPVAAAQGSGSPTVSYYGLGIYRPFEITAGPDGALWFTNSNPSSIGSGHDGIGRISTSGAVTGYSGSGITQPEGIAAGSDGALWFTNNGINGIGSSIGRITTSGTVTNFTDTSINRPTAITAGPDGALWFINSGNDSIGRITTAGVGRELHRPEHQRPGVDYGWS